LRRTLAAWDLQLAQTCAGQPARLLERLAEGASRARPARMSRLPRRLAS
jgi:hypothetical protein